MERLRGERKRIKGGYRGWEGGMKKEEVRRVESEVEKALKSRQ
jgi:hypothetical protein